MLFIIDGHNLIPHVPGISLKDMDDENQLIKALQQFCVSHRHQVRVFFDRAAARQAGKRNHGNVTAYFVKQGKTADRAIREHLHNAGQQAQHWALVSSDNEVRQSGKWAHMKLYTSDEFSRLMQQPAPGKPGADTAADTHLNDAEVADWLQIFGREGKEK